MSRAALTRAMLGEGASGSARPPARIIHLGLGNFFRAHQAWYTARSRDAAEWGIAAFTGRSAELADTLTAQDCLYTLVVRGWADDAVEIVTSLAEAVDGADTARLQELAADPGVSVITMTVTEAGYRLRSDGSPDLGDPELVADLQRIPRGSARTAIGRLLLALSARRESDAGPIAIVPCDNIPANGDFLARGVRSLAVSLDSELARWIGDNVSFVSTSVDRITPRAEGASEIARVGEWADACPVVTETFSDWVLAGDFPAGRPDWESAGARFVDDIAAWENRKLWLLNGAHLILCFAGLLKGLDTIAAAIRDPACRALVESFWGEAMTCLPSEVDGEEYCRRLIDRFENPRLVHRLDQIAAEATSKTQFRFAAVAERVMRSGGEPIASAAAFAAWIDWVTSDGRAPDGRAADVRRAKASPDPVQALIAVVSPALAEASAFVERVRAALASPTGRSDAPNSHSHIES